jgi:pimeloyl-ACP methyl ester carboxylesterase
LNPIEEQIIALESEAVTTQSKGELGTVTYRTWQPWGDQMGGELVVMMHGGSGSWSHWIRNIPKLSDYYELLVPDLPSLGDSSTLPSDTEPKDIAQLMVQTLKQMVGPRRFHLVAFSWRCVISALVAAELGSQVKSILLVGPASTGKPPTKNTMQPLISRTKDMSEDEVDAANRENLARLMIHDRQKIDGLAVALQTRNTTKARYNSPRHAMKELLLGGCRKPQQTCWSFTDRKIRSACLIWIGENHKFVPFALTWFLKPCPELGTGFSMRQRIGSMNVP